MESKESRMGQKGTSPRAGGQARALGRSSPLVGWAQRAIRFFLAAALAGGQILSGCSPFGLAMVGASGAGSEGFAALMGATLGYLLSRGPGRRWA